MSVIESLSGARLRWALADGATLTRRYLAHLRREPT